MLCQQSVCSTYLMSKVGSYQILLSGMVSGDIGLEMTMYFHTIFIYTMPLSETQVNVKRYYSARIHACIFMGAIYR